MIKGTSRQDQNIAAAVLIKMNVTPVVVMNYSFGGDNHGDTGLAGEAAQTVASTAALGDLITRLTTYGLQDNVTIAFQNVFGRTLNIKSHSNNADGRNHNASHHCTVMIGKGFKGSLIGGVELTTAANDYRATAIELGERRLGHRRRHPVRADPRVGRQDARSGRAASRSAWSTSRSRAASRSPPHWRDRGMAAAGRPPARQQT